MSNIMNQLKGMSKEELIKRKRELQMELFHLEVDVRQRGQKLAKGESFTNTKKNIARITQLLEAKNVRTKR